MNAMRIEGLGSLNLLIELAFFTCLWRFFTTFVFGLSWGQWLAGLSTEVDRLALAGVVWFDFLLAPLLPVSVLTLFLKKRSLSEFFLGQLMRTRLRPHRAQLLLIRLPLAMGLMVLIIAFHGVLSRWPDPVRVGKIVDSPLVVNYQKSSGTVYSSNRFRVKLTSDLRNSLGVRRVSLIPSFEVERRLGKKLFYPELVIFDRETKSFAALSLYKELEYEQFVARARAIDPSWSTRYPRLSSALSQSRPLESLASARDFQNFLMDCFEFDVDPVKSVLKAPLSSRSRSRALFDLFNLLDLGFSPEASRMTLSNESFIRLRGSDEQGLRREYWLTTRGPRLRVFELNITKGAAPWSTAEVVAILFKDAKWDWQADLPFPIGLLKDEINALSVVDLYTKSELNSKEKEEIERFLFFHFFELARDSLLFKQQELQQLIVDTLERFLIIANTSSGEKGSTLYSPRFQKKLNDLKESLSTQDLNYYKIP